MLSFGKANAKHKKLDLEAMDAIGDSFVSIFRGLSPNIKNFYTFSLPAGYTCPGALQCLTYAHRETGKIQDGPEQEFRCYAASMECTYPTVRASRWSNYMQLNGLTSTAMSELITASIPKDADIVRIHVSGDFFSPQYFDAWVEVARRWKNTLFYAYTKSLQYIQTDDLPANLQLTASRGGKWDSEIEPLHLNAANVVFSDDDDVEDIIDNNDINAIIGGTDFSLVLHGTQPKGTPAGEALKLLRKATV